MKLRGKTLLVLMMVAVVPLLVTLAILSSSTKAQIRGNMLQTAEKSVTLVERSTESAQRELTNYLRLISGSSDLVNAVYYASLTQDTDQLSEYLNATLQQYDLDLLEVLTPDGSVMIRQHTEGLTFDTESDLANPAIAASMNDEIKGSLSSYSGHLSIVVATPIKLQEQVVGYMVAAILLDDQFASHIKNLSGVDVAFIGPQGVLGTSHVALNGLDLTTVNAMTEDNLAIEGTPHLPIVRDLVDQNHRILIAMDRSSEVSAMQALRNLMMVLLIAVSAVVLLIALAFSRALTRPLLEVVDNLKEIAQGEADLTRTLKVSGKDEVGELAINFNDFVARLREMVQRIRGTATGVFTATEKIKATSQEVASGTTQQAEALEESFMAIQGIDESAVDVANSIGTLSDAVEVSSSATLELGATTEEIASQVERLFSTIEEVSSSITEMTVSGREVAENLDSLSSSTEMTAASITEMDASIKEVEETAQQTNNLSEEASIDAEKGKTAVAETIAGIQNIRDTVEDASKTIADLGKQSGEIGSILTVIDEVSDQTRLLSLNASIIAAQAGEHGKGFAVVADEIRELAERTALSTQEIAAIISRLQTGTEDAVKTMLAGSEQVKEEAERSKVAEEALDKITASAVKSAQQVKSIVRATQEQSRGSRQITEAVNQIANMLQQIAQSVNQQSKGNQQLAQASESMKDIASQVKLSTGEQAKGSHQINANMERIRSMMQQIDQATKDQSQRSQQVVVAVSAVRDVAEANKRRTTELDQIIFTLTEQASDMEKEIGSFKS
jgi:methyl-accepting chemotaxis protein